LEETSVTARLGAGCRPVEVLDVTTRPPLDYLGHLARESARFREILRDAPPDAQVPTCPDWDADDLLWHLGRVQWFWASVVRERVTLDEDAERLEAIRPDDRVALWDFFDRSSAELLDALASTPSDTRVWTWSDDHTVRFILRRQAHEALIHRVDAELTVGRRTPLDRHLAADGVDEALSVMYGGQPSWGQFRPEEGRQVRIVSTDTGDSWRVALGRFAGADPEGAEVDEADLRVVPDIAGAPAPATVAGAAGDLDCWLWHRPTSGGIERSGDAGVLDALESVIAPGIG
jgi:uncharacterized protein (TIGR03083 family)